jgi:cytoskeleton protein RodZ
VGESRLVITATKDSWIELSEASGRVVWARVLPAGQTLKPEATPPLRLVVGNARATQVTFDGRTLDLEASARGNVARIDIR